RYEDLKCWRSLNTGEYGHLMGDMWNNNACTHNVFERVHISRAGHRPARGSSAGRTLGTRFPKGAGNGCHRAGLRLED
ncbi:MAG: hypothetical protein QGF68_15580, partial [Nitrospinota bacterium]|nr:hypothetical protein [Nitrospinota bacterium]